MQDSRPSVVTRALGRCIVLAHATTPPTDEEWESILQTFSAAGQSVGARRALVHTEGAAPNVMQRARMNEVFGKEPPRVSVMTPSKLARAAGAALRWFNPKLRVFNPDEMDAALLHLEVSAEEGAWLTTNLREIKIEMGILRQGAALRSR